ncbi:MAG: hypothetical protein RL215_2632, partial [Planctomycetota bacterium]
PADEEVAEEDADEEVVEEEPAVEEPAVEEPADEEAAEEEAEHAEGDDTPNSEPISLPTPNKEDVPENKLHLIGRKVKPERSVETDEPTAGEIDSPVTDEESAPVEENPAGEDEAAVEEEEPEVAEVEAGEESEVVDQIAGEPISVHPPTMVCVLPTPFSFMIMGFPVDEHGKPTGLLPSPSRDEEIVVTSTPENSKSILVGRTVRQNVAPDGADTGRVPPAKSSLLQRTVKTAPAER